jgi:hypothetical protein
MCAVTEQTKLQYLHELGKICMMSNLTLFYFSTFFLHIIISKKQGPSFQLVEKFLDYYGALYFITSHC